MAWCEYYRMAHRFSGYCVTHLSLIACSVARTLTSRNVCALTQSYIIVLPFLQRSTITAELLDFMHELCSRERLSVCIVQVG